MYHTTFCNSFRAVFFLRFVNVLSAFIRIADFDPVYPVWLGCKILLNRPGRTSSCYFQNSTETHPLPRFRYLKGQFIVDTPLHTVQLLIAVTPTAAYTQLLQTRTVSSSPEESRSIMLPMQMWMMAGSAYMSLIPSPLPVPTAAWCWLRTLMALFTMMICS